MNDPIKSTTKTIVVLAKAWRWPVSRRRSTGIAPALGPILSAASREAAMAAFAKSRHRSGYSICW
jgi:hypothetical protein